jgi:VCBS repeat protein
MKNTRRLSILSLSLLFLIAACSNSSPNNNGGGGGGGNPPLTLSFADAVSYVALALGTNSQSIAVGDFDGGGKLDLAVANEGEATNNVSVFLGNGDGTFPTRKDFPAALTFPVTTLVAADLNGDGKLDLAAASNSELALLNNDGSANLFGAATVVPAVGNGTRNMTAGDFDGTNGTDLVVTSTAGNNISVLLNNGSGAFNPKTDFDGGGGKIFGPRGVVATDFNGDGKIDLALADFGVDLAGKFNLNILFNNGSGAFPAAQDFIASATSANQGIAAGDFNGDGKNDVVVSNLDDHVVYVFLNDGSGSFGSAVPYSTGDDCGAVAVADFDLDGNLDIAAADAVGQDAVHGDVAVLLGNGDGTFQDKKLFSAGTTAGTINNPRSITVGDFNGDGKPDIALVNNNNGINPSVSILLNTSN